MNLRQTVDHAPGGPWRAHRDVLRTHARARRVAELLGEHRQPGSVTPSDLEKVAVTLHAEGLGHATVNRYVAAFTSALTGAYADGVIPSPPPRFKWRKEGKGRERFPSRGQVALMLRSFRRTGAPQSADLTRFLYATGCRLGEALGLGRFDVMLDGSHVNFHGTKNGTDREIPVPPRVRELLVRRRRSTPHRLFEIPASTFSSRWRCVRGRLTIGPWFTPHTLRHARASELVRVGVPIPTVSAILGHSSWRSTQRYTHATHEDMVKAMEQR